MTAELVEMLGADDAAVRRDVAVATLTTWLTRGVYDDLLPGLGDGLADRLFRGRTAIRRGCTAEVLGACIAHDRTSRRVPHREVLSWGDRLATWLVAEQDATAIGQGADALAKLVAHPACGGPELAVLLDILGETATGVTDNDVCDQLAAATLAILWRGLVPVDVVEAWLDRLEVEEATYVRSLYVLLSLTPAPPADRADLVLLVIERLRALHPALRGGHRRSR